MPVHGEGLYQCMSILYSEDSTFDFLQQRALADGRFCVRAKRLHGCGRPRRLGARLGRVQSGTRVTYSYFSHDPIRFTCLG